MNRLTSNKSVSEMSMYELAHNSCYAKDGNARYRDYDTDIDARELAIKLLEKYADIPNEFTCDEYFDDFISDFLQYGTECITGVIAVLYQHIWAMADLRERLKEYEDLEEIFRSKMTDAACDFLKDKEEFARWLDRNKWIAKKCDEYARAEGQGKLLKLPCTVGDKIYLPNKYLGKVIDFEITRICIFKEDIMFIDNLENEYFIDDFGKTVFITKEEAEAALKEMGEKS